MEKDKNNLDELLERALAAEQDMPEGLHERLEKQIDIWAEAEKRQKQQVRRRFACWISGIAAAALLAVGIFRYDAPAEGQEAGAIELAQAHAAAQDALQMFFGNLNKGVAQIDNAAQNINKANEVLNKQITINRK